MSPATGVGLPSRPSSPPWPHDPWSPHDTDPALDHRDAQRAQPPAWFDITAQDAAKSRQFYGELFGWEINVVESMNYGIVEAAPERIPGGIGQAGQENPHPAGVVVYFEVNDVEAALELAERLGGKRAVAGATRTRELALQHRSGEHS